MTVVNGEIVRTGEPLAVTRPPMREIRVVEDSSAVANIMDTARFEHIQRVARLMACSSLLPNHLRYVAGKPDRGELSPDVQAANCFRVVNQALRWGFDPFAIVDETYMVGGKLGYQGKLVAAVVNAKAGLKSRLCYEFSGQGQNLTVRVSGVFQGEDEERDVTLRVADAKTDNQMWFKDPEQKLIYSGVVKWARRHCPEVVMGVITDDDLERMALADQRQPGSNLNDRLKLAKTEIAEQSAEAPAAAPVGTHKPGSSEDPATSPENPQTSAVETSAPAEDTGGDAGGAEQEPLSQAVLEACGKWTTFAEWAALAANEEAITESTAGDVLTAYNMKRDIKSAKSSGTANRMALAEAIGKEGFTSATTVK